MPQELRELNQALATYIRNSAALEVGKLAIQKFMYTGLVAAVAAPMVLASFSSVIDTPWGVALNRAVKVVTAPAHADALHCSVIHQHARLCA